MIKERVKEAKEILKEIGRDSFVSGSFLFSKEYNDIDVYVISNKRKQYNKGKKHFIFITKEDLKKPIFVSAAKYCVSNFSIDMEPKIERPNFDDLIMTYEQAIIEILDNDDQKMIRELIFQHRMLIHNEVLDSLSLNNVFNEIKKMRKDEKIKYVNILAKDLLLKLYSKKYIYNEISPFITRLKKESEEYEANDNLRIYIEMLSEVKHESRRAKA